MNIVEIDPIANQAFSVQIGDISYNIQLKMTNNVIAATIAINNVIVISGARLVANCLILPFEYQEDGNFMILTQNNELPNYQKFGVTQFLYYFSPDDIASFRTGGLYFSPYAPLPPRYDVKNSSIVGV